MHRLAIQLGKTVEQLEQEMSSQAFTRWQAYWQLEPWGAWRDNLHAAQIASLLYNINRGKQRPVKVSDFFYEDLEVKTERTAKTFVQRLRSMVTGNG